MCSDVSERRCRLSLSVRVCLCVFVCVCVCLFGCAGACVRVCRVCGCRVKQRECFETYEMKCAISMGSFYWFLLPYVAEAGVADVSGRAVSVSAWAGAEPSVADSGQAERAALAARIWLYVGIDAILVVEAKGLADWTRWGYAKSWALGGGNDRCRSRGDTCLGLDGGELAGIRRRAVKSGTTLALSIDASAIFARCCAIPAVILVGLNIGAVSEIGTENFAWISAIRRRAAAYLTIRARLAYKAACIAICVGRQ